jgi:hypothetical protein
MLETKHQLLGYVGLGFYDPFNILVPQKTTHLPQITNET